MPLLSRKVGEKEEQHLFSFNTLFPRMKSSYPRTYVIDKTNTKKRKNPYFLQQKVILFKPVGTADTENLLLTP